MLKSIDFGGPKKKKKRNMSFFLSGRYTHMMAFTIAYICIRSTNIILIHICYTGHKPYEIQPQLHDDKPDSVAWRQELERSKASLTAPAISKRKRNRGNVDRRFSLTSVEHKPVPRGQISREVSLLHVYLSLFNHSTVRQKPEAGHPSTAPNAECSRRLS